MSGMRSRYPVAWRDRGGRGGGGGEGGGEGGVVGREEVEDDEGGRRGRHIAQRITKEVEPLDPTGVGVREGRELNGGLIEGLSGGGHLDWGQDRGKISYRRRNMSGCFLKDHGGEKIVRWMVVNGRISWRSDWGKLGLRRMVGGGRFPSPGLIPGGAPFSLAPEVRHVKCQRRSWEEVEARACEAGSPRRVAPEGRRIVHRELGSGE
jgi:hypothetical protein